MCSIVHRACLAAREAEHWGWEGGAAHRGLGGQVTAALMEVLREAQRPQDINTPAATCSASGAVGIQWPPVAGGWAHNSPSAGARGGNQQDEKELVLLSPAAHYDGDCSILNCCCEQR